jgi:ribosomal protein S18 acetylase RimI-like enzyme
MDRKHHRFQIRLANHDDAITFLKLEAKCFKMRTNKDTIYFWTPAVCYLWSYKAMINGKIVGGVVATPTRDGYWYVDSLFVDPSYRKHGVATRLLSKIIKAAGNKRIFLNAKTNRRFLIDFYNKHGFKLQKLEKNYYNDGNDLYLLVHTN